MTLRLNIRENMDNTRQVESELNDETSFYPNFPLTGKLSFLARDLDLNHLLIHRNLA